MKKLADFLRDEYPKLPARERKKIMNQKRAKWFIEKYLMDPGDTLIVERKEVPIGMKITYIVKDLIGNWMKLPFLERNSKEEMTKKEFEYFKRESIKSAFKWIMSGKCLKEWNITATINIEKEDILFADRQILVEARDEYILDRIKFKHSTN